jgi:hypothetical protein
METLTGQSGHAGHFTQCPPGSVITGHAGQDGHTPLGVSGMSGSGKTESSKLLRKPDIRNRRRQQCFWSPPHARQGRPPGATVMSSRLRSPKLTKAIRRAIREAELAYEFCPASYTMGALNAVLAVEQVYLREADRLALYLDHHHDITTNRARTS